MSCQHPTAKGPPCTVPGKYQCGTLLVCGRHQNVMRVRAGQPEIPLPPNEQDLKIDEMFKADNTLPNNGLCAIMPYETRNVVNSIAAVSTEPVPQGKGKKIEEEKKVVEQKNLEVIAAVEEKMKPNVVTLNDIISTNEAIWMALMGAMRLGEETIVSAGLNISGTCHDLLVNPLFKDTTLACVDEHFPGVLGGPEMTPTTKLGLIVGGVMVKRYITNKASPILPSSLPPVLEEVRKPLFSE